MPRIPKSPPPFDELIQEAAQSGRLEAVLGTTVRPSIRYHHWDKLRHLKPPDDFSHREWWLSLKFRRGPLAKIVPLQSTERTLFTYVLADPIPERLHDIDLRGGGVIAMPEPITNPETKDRYLISSLIEEAIRSSQLEGAATTRAAAGEMIRAGRSPRDRSERMILNNFRTMQRIGALRDERLTKELVCELHHLITQDTLDDPSMAGRFRTPDRKIDVGDDYGQTFHIPPRAEELEDRMDVMCAFANHEIPKEFVHPVIRSMILHFWLAYDHPFVDGNGRTARALFYWSMLRCGYWLCEYISISEIILKGPSKYGRAFLHTETDDNDLTYFLIYHLDVIRQSFDQLDAYVKRKTEELHRLEQKLRGLRLLNHRQEALMSHALRHPHHDYVIESHRASHGVTHQTARTDLLNLAKRGLLDSRKVGREWHFRPSPDLDRRLVEMA